MSQNVYRDQRLACQGMTLLSFAVLHGAIRIARFLYHLPIPKELWKMEKVEGYLQKYGLNLNDEKDRFRYQDFLESVKQMEADTSSLLQRKLLSISEKLEVDACDMRTRKIISDRAYYDILAFIGLIQEFVYSKKWDETHWVAELKDRAFQLRRHSELVEEIIPILDEVKKKNIVRKFAVTVPRDQDYAYPSFSALSRQEYDQEREANKRDKEAIEEKLTSQKEALEEELSEERTARKRDKEALEGEIRSQDIKLQSQDIKLQSQDIKLQSQDIKLQSQAEELAHERSRRATLEKQQEETAQKVQRLEEKMAAMLKGRLLAGLGASVGIVGEAGSSSGVGGEEKRGEVAEAREAREEVGSNGVIGLVTPLRDGTLSGGQESNDESEVAQADVSEAESRERGAVPSHRPG